LLARRLLRFIILTKSELMNVPESQQHCALALSTSPPLQPRTMKTNMVKENMKAWENSHLAKMLYNVGTRVKDGL
jgi:hypothetical protein